MNPVVEVLHTRKQTASLPGRRQDPHRVGLAIEGGGMRGVVTAGMATAIESLGLLASFDVVVGTSSGAFNAAYLLAGQAGFGTTVYYDDINNSNFISRARFFSRRPMMSLEFLVDHVMRRVKVLDCRAILASPIPMKVVVTSVADARAEIRGGFQTPEDLLETLRASARLPVIAGEPVQLDGRPYFDGGIFEPIPYRSATALGCTHVLVLLSRGDRMPPRPVSLASRLLTRIFLRRWRHLVPQLFDRPRQYALDLASLRRATAGEGGGPPFLFAVWPGEDCPELGRLETRRERLVAGAKAGFRGVYEALAGISPRVHEVLAAFSPEGLRV